MKSSSFLVAILLSFGFNSLQSGQAKSRPIRQPEDLLKQEARDALYAAQARLQQAMRKALLKEKPRFFTTPGGYKIPLQQSSEGSSEASSESSSEDNFYQADYHVPTRESSLTIDTSNSAIAHIILPTETIVATPSTKRDLSPLRSDDFFNNTDDDEDRLDSPESEQQKRSRPEAFQDMNLLNRSLTPPDLVFTNDLLN
jgi:hypothetical protein